MSNHTVLYVSNIANKARRDDIQHYFSKYGNIYDICIPLDYHTGRMKGYAFVEFKHSSDAKEAYKRLDKTEFLGRVIDIEFARGRKRTPAEMMRLESVAGHGGGDSGHIGKSSRRSRSRSRRSRSAESPRRSEDAKAKTKHHSSRRPASPVSSSSRQKNSRSFRRNWDEDRKERSRSGSVDSR